jgi:hypothetical protein
VVFLEGVLQKMGVSDGISVVLAWWIAGKNVVNGWCFCGSEKHANF